VARNERVLLMIVVLLLRFVTNVEVRRTTLVTVLTKGARLELVGA
jgi:hypothetical protein